MNNKVISFSFLILFILSLCSCSRLHGLKRDIELRHEDMECLSNGKIIHTHNLDSLSIIRIEEIANEVKTWKTVPQFFPWEDVALSIFKNPEDINFREGKCEHCENSLISIDYISPQWTWEHLCGRAGRLIICQTCKEQIAFELEAMN